MGASFGTFVKTYVVSAWTISEQTVGEFAITTMGSPSITSSHSRCTWLMTLERQRNMSPSKADVSITVRGNSLRGDCSNADTVGTIDL